MPRLIDADVLRSVFTEKSSERVCGIKLCKAIIYRIDHTPTVDAVPVKHGKWIDETFKPWGLVHHPYKCDQCGEHSEAPSDFCPGCGARMDK